MHHPRLLALVAAASIGLFANSALAQGTAEQREACQEDAFRLCSAEIPDEKKVEMCLLKSRAQLSPACRALFTATETRKPAR